MVDSPLLEFIAHGREERNLEYKQSMSWNEPDSRGNLIKRIMSMANISDGGVLVVGVRQENEQFFLDGMDPTHLATFQQDKVSEDVNDYASPYVELTVNHVPYEGKTFVVIEVREFAELPVICRKAGPGGLRPGAVYTRGRRRHETVEVANEPEMRELLDLAVDKGIRRQVRRYSEAGLPIQTSPEQAADEQKRFEDQLGGL